jgi:hypothetical protein
LDHEYPFREDSGIALGMTYLSQPLDRSLPWHLVRCVVLGMSESHDHLEFRALHEPSGLWFRWQVEVLTWKRHGKEYWMPYVPNELSARRLRELRDLLDAEAQRLAIACLREIEAQQRTKAMTLTESVERLGKSISAMWPQP